MSNIYINEPSTNGKVLLETTVGDFDIELWSKEAPKACRNFIQLCMEHYYDGSIFHRIVKGFIAQVGDPTGTGFGGDSIYGAPFKDEFHQRLRFSRGGLVGMANSGPNDNGSQFFFTFDDAPDLQNKHTLFGKLTGNTRFNISKLEECETDKNDRPVHPPKIRKATILSNPFPDIVPRQIERTEDLAGGRGGAKGKNESAAVKNYALLSFGDEACDDEEEIHTITKEGNIKGNAISKSSHDLLDDPSLSKSTALDTSPKDQPSDESSDEHLSQDESYQHNGKGNIHKDAVLNKLRELKSKNTDVDPKPKSNKRKMEDDKSSYLRQGNADGSNDTESEKEEEPEKPDPRTIYRSELAKEALGELRDINQVYKEKQKSMLPKGPTREQQTLQLLATFKQTLTSRKIDDSDANHISQHNGSVEEIKRPSKEISLFVEDEWEGSEKSDGDDYDPKEWMSHRFLVTDQPVEDEVLGAPIKLAKDANIENLDRYDITDPRHPINVRKRLAGMEKVKHGQENHSPPYVSY